MAKKLYGTDPDQVPTNADLGTIAYQDKDNVHLTGRVMVSAVNPAPFTVPNASESLEINDGSTTKLLMYADNSNAYIQASKYDGTNPGRTLIFATKQGTDGIAAESARFNVSGNLAFPSGQGIDFSATGDGSGTMTSELLDDYEEGNWSPALSYGGTSATLTSSTGQYVKIGRLVHVWLMIQVGNLNSGSGSIELSGLPYSSSGNMVYYHGNIQGNAEMNLPTGAGSVMPYVTGGTSTARFLYMTNSTHNDVTSTHFPAPITVYGQMTYSTAT